MMIVLVVVMVLMVVVVFLARVLFLQPPEKKAKRKSYFCPNSICISVPQFCKFLAEVFCEKSDLMFPSEPGLYFRLEPGEKRNFPHLVTN